MVGAVHARCRPGGGVSDVAGRRPPGRAARTVPAAAARGHLRGQRHRVGGDQPHLSSCGRPRSGPCRDPDEMTSAEAGDMRNPVLRVLDVRNGAGRALITAAVLLAMAPGCTSLGSRLGGRGGRGGAGRAGAGRGGAGRGGAGRGGAGRRPRRAARRPAVSGNAGVQLRVTERAARSVRPGGGTAVAAGHDVGCRQRSARRAGVPDRRARPARESRSRRGSRRGWRRGLARRCAATGW